MRGSGSPEGSGLLIVGQAILQMMSILLYIYLQGIPRALGIAASSIKSRAGKNGLRS